MTANNVDVVQRLSVPLRVTVDLAHGGRWTSLVGGGREWLLTLPTPGRAAVCPDDPFVDAGGLEECIPTVRGIPDHGSAWSRAWRRDDRHDVVEGPDYELRRSIDTTGPSVVTDYQLTAEPGLRFVWAAHALLDLSEDARLDAPAGTPVRVYPDSAHRRDGLSTSEPGWVQDSWPQPAGLPLHLLGPDDGTAVGAVLVGCAAVTVHDGADFLTLRLQADSALPFSTGLWRNLGGFPPDRPYRSIGVEPMLGQVFDRQEAGPNEAATVPDSGEVSWRLEITAGRRTDGPG